MNYRVQEFSASTLKVTIRQNAWICVSETLISPLLEKLTTSFLKSPLKKVNMLLITRKDSSFFFFVWLHLHVFLQTLHLGVAINSYDFSNFLFHLLWSVVTTADSVWHKRINTGIEDHSLSLSSSKNVIYFNFNLPFHLFSSYLIKFFSHIFTLLYTFIFICPPSALLLNQFVSLPFPFHLHLCSFLPLYILFDIYLVDCFILFMCVAFL